MGRLIKALVWLAVFGLLGLAGFAYLGDLAPVQGVVSQPVTLDAN